jgi:hypothetical protein
MPKVTNTYRIAEDVDAVIKADAKKLKTSQADIIERSVEKAHPMLMDEHRIGKHSLRGALIGPSSSGTQQAGGRRW